MHIIYNVLEIMRKARTEMLSSHFFAVPISYANNTLLTRLAPISGSTLSFLVVETI